MNNRYSLTDIPNLNKRVFFFDTNVLMYLYYPSTASSQNIRQYTNLFHQLLTHQAKLMIDSNVLSEFINASLRIEYKNANTSVGYKQYRNTAAGKQKVQDIYNLALSILSTFDIVGNIASTRHIQSLLTVDSLDFNDKLIESNCLQNNFIVVTNDIDFKNSNCDILTLNRNF